LFRTAVAIFLVQTSASSTVYFLPPNSSFITPWISSFTVTARNLQTAWTWFCFYAFLHSKKKVYVSDLSELRKMDRLVAQIPANSAVKIPIWKNHIIIMTMTVQCNCQKKGMLSFQGVESLSFPQLAMWSHWHFLGLYGSIHVHSSPMPHNLSNWQHN
jgi:hypothetical protein